MEHTRLGSKLAPFRGELKAKRQDYEERFAALDRKLLNITCYYCKGTNGALTCKDTQILACGHACHIKCWVEFKAQQHAGQQKVETSESDALLLFQIYNEVRSLTTYIYVSNYRDVDQVWDWYVCKLQQLSRRLLSCERVLAAIDAQLTHRDTPGVQPCMTLVTR